MHNSKPSVAGMYHLLEAWCYWARWEGINTRLPHGARFDALLKAKSLQRIDNEYHPTILRDDPHA